MAGPPRFAGVLLASVLLVSSMVLGLSAPGVAVAQPGPASLVGVTMSDGAPGETKVLLSFNQIIPQFSIVTNDADRSLIGFADTVRGSAASVPAGARGVLKSIEFNQRGSTLTIAFVGTEPIHIDATAIEGRAVSLSIKAANAPKAAAVASTAQLPQHEEAKPGENDFEVVPLKYADVSEVVGLLSAGQAIRPNDAFTPQEPAFGASGFTNNGVNNQNNNLLASNFNPNATDAASTTYGQSIDDSIGVDRRLNAIILKGSPERIATLKARIALLDVPVKSVLLETVFVELTETGARNIGLDFNNANGQIAVATYQRGAYVGSNGAAGVDVAGYGSYALQAAIYAEVRKGQGRIVSRPRISAQSGTSAKIITGDALPILTSIALSGLNALQQQVQYVNVGVTLQIAPARLAPTAM